MFTDITAFGSSLLVALVTNVSAAYLAAAGKRRLAILVAVSISLGSMVEKLMRPGFDRARSDIFPHFVTVPFPQLPERPHLSQVREASYKIPPYI